MRLTAERGDDRCWPCILLVAVHEDGREIVAHLDLEEAEALAGDLRRSSRLLREFFDPGGDEPHVEVAARVFVPRTP